MKTMIITLILGVVIGGVAVVAHNHYTGKGDYSGKSTAEQVAAYWKTDANTKK